MNHTTHYAKTDFTGLCSVNLVDFDSQFGHRRDADGYARALNEFDRWLGEFLPTLTEDDAVIITADHGCDPAYAATTDHTREYVPMLALGKTIRPVNLGTRSGFADIAATVADLLGVPFDIPGKSFAPEIGPLA
jgi:phosphopentomutase